MCQKSASIARPEQSFPTATMRRCRAVFAPQGLRNAQPYWQWVAHDFRLTLMESAATLRRLGTRRRDNCSGSTLIVQCTSFVSAKQSNWTSGMCASGSCVLVVARMLFWSSIPGKRLLMQMTPSYDETTRSFGPLKFSPEDEVHPS